MFCTIVHNIFEGIEHDDVKGLNKKLPAGSIQWSLPSEDGKHRSMLYVCPCGCQQVRSIPIKPPSADGWNWNQNEIHPTLTPSILHVAVHPGDCKWHGFLTNGEWKTC